MFMKRIFNKIHRRYIQFRWHLPAAGASLLSNSFLKEYQAKRRPIFEILQAHRMGFTCEDWCILGLNKNNCKTYLSNVDYYGLHPINGSFTKWIDDKQTLKYLCSGTALDKYMPAYYYHLDSEGHVLCLIDCPNKTEIAVVEDIAELLQEKGVLALKLEAGSIGAGFYKGEYKNNVFSLNGEEMDRAEFCKRLRMLRNYLITEYLQPHAELARYCPDTVNCIRYLVGRIDGKMERFVTFIRFGTKASGFVENYGVGGVLCMLDADGHFTEGNIIDWASFTNRTIYQHPDNQQPLQGTIPHWNEIVQAVKEFSLHFPQLKYMGIDFVVTSDDRIKVLEINSLNSSDSLQLAGSVFNTNAGVFFRSLMGK